MESVLSTEVQLNDGANGDRYLFQNRAHHPLGDALFQLPQQWARIPEERTTNLPTLQRARKPGSWTSDSSNATAPMRPRASMPA